MKLVVPLLFTLISCIPTMQSTDLKFTSSKTSSENGLSAEKKLWAKNCASCHTNSGNGHPTKLYVSPEDIASSITTVPTMKHLSKLTSSQIEMISVYLNKEAIKEINKNKPSDQSRSIAVIGNRSYVISKLKTIYMSPENNGNDMAIDGIIQKINSYPGAFGGTCVSNYEACVGEATQNYNAPMLMEANIIRSGVMAKVCREIHNNDAAVVNALQYAGLTITDLPTAVNFNKAIEAYFPGNSELMTTLNPLLNRVFAKAMQSQMSNKQAWNLSLYIMCNSPVFEKL